MNLNQILDPRGVWEDQAAYEASAKSLAQKFAENFAKKYPDMPEHLKAAGPQA